MMAQKSKLMSMTGASESEPIAEDCGGMGCGECESCKAEEETADEPGEEPEEMGEESSEAPESLAPGPGIMEQHRAMLDQMAYNNPVMDSPEIDDATREGLNPSSDPYTQVPSLDTNSIDAPYNKLQLFQKDVTNLLQQKAQARALATAKFQDQAVNKKV